LVISQFDIGTKYTYLKCQWKYCWTATG